MTVRRRDDGDTPLGDWIRSQPELDSRLGYDLEDWDRIYTRQYFWHQFMHGHIMLVEEKQYDREMTFAQVDTLGIIHQAIQHSFRNPSFRIKRKNPTRPTKIAYYGYNLIQFERTSPTDGIIRVNKIKITEQELLRFFQFDKDFMKERLNITPQTISTDEQTLYHLLPKTKHTTHKNHYDNVPTLFNPTPTQQQSLWTEALP